MKRSRQAFVAADWCWSGLVVACLVGSMWMGPGVRAQPVAEVADFSYDAAPLRHVITDIQARTTYRFLYRDALIAEKRVTLRASAETVLAALTTVLRPLGLQLQVDERRRQVFLAEGPAPDRPEPQVLRGQVLDDETGVRLPYATLTWTRDGQLQGVTANEAGVFHLPLDPALARRDTLVVTASYVGYEPKQVWLNLKQPLADLSLRLRPTLNLGREVVVTGSGFLSDLDTTWHGLIQPDRYTPFGERNVIRSLQTLPAVGLTAAQSPGLNVRGSRSDGFQVLLDGIPIYNQSHFFGLFDAFNADALQAVGFYYDVAPASFFAPPGGTLAFVTRTGSSTGYHGTVGLSNAAVRGTFEGPLREGRSSWLLSGRHSYLNAVDWFNNQALIAQGLEVERETSPLPGRLADLDQRVLVPGDNAARFYDVHAKFYDEAPGGRRLTLNLYAGGNRTSQEAERIMAVQPIVRETVSTRNAWGNSAASLQYQRTLGNRSYLSALAAFSYYTSRFDKDDFVYKIARRQLGEGALPWRVGPFRQENRLIDLKVSQALDLATAGAGQWALGYDLHLYDIDYDQASLLRTSFVRRYRATQFDLFGQYDTVLAEALEVHAGLRTHYFSLGEFLRFSPRLQFRLFPTRPLSAGFGFSQNHQFLHRLYLQHTISPDVWIMSTADQPPGRVNNLSAGLYLKPGDGAIVQVEVYRKRYENLRQHEVNGASQRATRPELKPAPWYHDSEALARGIEVLQRQRLGPLLWSNSYTLSRVEIRNEQLNDGAAYRADWDRTHQFMSRLEASLPFGLTPSLTWFYATGAPRSLTDAENLVDTASDVMPAYHRLDAGLRYDHPFEGARLQFGVSIFNVYDRQNAWYQDILMAADPARRQLRYINVDVYDLGLQPSFDLSVSF